MSQILSDTVHVRKYAPGESPSVGDVVRQNGDTGAFCTSIIRFIWTSDGATTVHLERPHAKVGVIGSMKGQVYHAAEDYTVDLRMLRERYEVHVTGKSGNRDNRSW